MSSQPSVPDNVVDLLERASQADNLGALADLEISYWKTILAGGVPESMAERLLWDLHVSITGMAMGRYASDRNLSTVLVATAYDDDDCDDDD